MIYLKSITIKNFLSHQNSHIDFKPNMRLLISGMSGSGKSSIVEAIVWCLYGKGRTENKNLIKKGCVRAEVILCLSEELPESDEINSYVITRSISDNGRQVMSINKNNQPVAIHGIKESQDWLEKSLLRASYLLFVNSIASPQDNPDNFVKQTASKKKDLLLELSGADDYDAYYDKTRVMLSDGENEIKILQARLDEKYLQTREQSKLIFEDLSISRNTIELEIKRIKKKLLDITQEKNNILNKHKELSFKKDQHNSLKQTEVDLRSKLTLKEGKLRELEGLDEEKINYGYQEYQILKKELSEIDETISKEYLVSLEYQSFLSSKPFMVDYSGDMKNIKKQMEMLYKNNDITCPFCGKNNPKLEQSVKTQVEHLKQQMDDKVSKNETQTQLSLEWEIKSASIVHPRPLEGLKMRRSELLGIMSGLEHFLSDLTKLGAKNELILSLKTDIEEIYSNISQNNDNILKTELEIKRLSEEIDVERSNYLDLESKSLTDKEGVLELELSGIIKTITLSDAAKLNILKLKEEVDTILKKIKEKNKTIEWLSILKDAFSPKGIKTIVIDYLVPRLEDKINNILQELSDFRIQIDTQKTGTDKETMVEGLFINIINQEGNTLDYSNYSGGEKMKIDYSISEALAGLSKIKFRILDETISSLDDDMLSCFMEILAKINYGYKQLIVISHIGQVKDLFEEKLIVNKQNGSSVIS